MRFDSNNLEETLTLASQIGANCKGGEVIELVSDLGGGKTAFVRGLARGMGSRDDVSSPSFTLSNEYRAENNTLYHFDFYRLSEPGIMRQELAEVLDDKHAVIAIEWADVVNDVLPTEHITITIETTGEDSRTYCVTYPDEFSYITKGV